MAGSVHCGSGVLTVFWSGENNACAVTWTQMTQTLPEEVVSVPTLSSFRRRLKPFFFQQSYPDIVI